MRQRECNSKREFTSQKETAKEMIAFANSHGGMILALRTRQEICLDYHTNPRSWFWYHTCDEGECKGRIHK